jgi:hypothetical protein
MLFFSKSEDGAQKKLEIRPVSLYDYLFTRRGHIALRVYRKFCDGVFEDSFWDIISLQTLQGSGAVFPKLFARGRLLASEK